MSVFTYTMQFCSKWPFDRTVGESAPNQWVWSVWVAGWDTRRAARCLAGTAFGRTPGEWDTGRGNSPSLRRAAYA